MTQKIKGFTILEIAVVIILIGTMATFAIPNLLKTTYFSYSEEAIKMIEVIRESMERCYQTSLITADTSTYDGCTIGSLVMDDPNTRADRHFDYTAGAGLASPASEYGIVALRNTADLGDGTSTLYFFKTDASGNSLFGTGEFSSIRNNPISPLTLQ